jgi:HlyD family secretion protein
MTTSPARRRTLWRRAPLILVAAALAAFIVFGLLPKPLPVDLGVVTTGPLTVSVLEEGKTRIRNRYVVSPPIAGYLRRVPVRAGDALVAGETVVAIIQAAPSAFLDPRARAQAEAAVRSAEAARMQRQEQRESAEAELELARKDLTRAETLRTKGAIAVQEFDTAANRVDRLANQLGSARFALKVSEFELEQARAALVQAEADPSAAGEPLTLRAPVSGRVLNVFEESARAVTPGQPILEVGDPADLEAEIELLSSDAVNVRPGAEVAIEQWGGDEPLHGRATVVEPGAFLKVSALGVEEQRVKVRVDFLNLPDGVLGDRFRVEARIVTWQSKSVRQVPTGALFRRGNDWMTFRVAGGRVRLTKVEIGRSDGISAQVLSGLEVGDVVILHPPDTLADGGSVVERRIP